MVGSPRVVVALVMAIIVAALLVVNAPGGAYSLLSGSVSFAPTKAPTAAPVIATQTPPLRWLPSFEDLLNGSQPTPGSTVKPTEPVKPTSTSKPVDYGTPKPGDAGTPKPGDAGTPKPDTTPKPESTPKPETTPKPTEKPTSKPTAKPTEKPAEPTSLPTPTPKGSEPSPTAAGTAAPEIKPTSKPSVISTQAPTPCTDNCASKQKRAIAQMHAKTLMNQFIPNHFLAPADATIQSRALVFTGMPGYHFVNTASKHHSCQALTDAGQLGEWLRRPRTERDAFELVFGQQLLNTAFYKSAAGVGSYFDMWRGPVALAFIVEHPLQQYLRVLNTRFNETEASEVNKVFVDELLAATNVYQRISHTFKTLTDEETVSYFIETSFSVVGVAEQFAESACLTLLAFGWAEETFSALPVVNGPFQQSLLDQASLDAFEDAAKADIIIYNAAKRVFARQLASSRGVPCKI